MIKQAEVGLLFLCDL